MGEKRWSYPDDNTGRVLSLMAENGFPMDRAMKVDFTSLSRGKARQTRLASSPR
jgi:hypothetical protein